MSIYYMRDNHTFRRLDLLTLEEAVLAVEEETLKEGGYGLVGGKGEHAHLGVFGWKQGEPWVERVQDMLLAKEK